MVSIGRDLILNEEMYKKPILCGFCIYIIYAFGLF